MHRNAALYENMFEIKIQENIKKYKNVNQDSSDNSPSLRLSSLESQKSEISTGKVDPGKRIPLHKRPLEKKPRIPGN